MRQWAWLSLVAFCGCDLFDSAKVDNPVFGPPPPRKAVASADLNGHAVYVDDKAAPQVQTASADAAIKQVSFTDIKGLQKPVPLSKISDNEVIASVNGQPIFASEVFERAYGDPHPLTTLGVNLFMAKKALEVKQLPEPEYRTLQDAAIHKFLKDYIKTRVLAQALRATLPKEQADKLNDAVNKAFEEHVDRLKKELKVTARHEVDEKLREQGTSIDSLKFQFENTILADEYMRNKAKKPHVIGREEICDYYNEHVDKYKVQEKVRWQLLEINIEKQHGRAKALELFKKAAAELEQGADFGKVAQKYSDGPHAEEGGKHDWTRPESVADAKTAAKLHDLPVGETSPMFRTKESYRLIRVTQRKPAGIEPLSKVQDAIRQELENRFQKKANQEVLNEAFAAASIETPYFTAEELIPTADSAGFPADEKKPTRSRKNKRDRP